MAFKIRPWVWQALILIAIYVLLGNSKTVHVNPYIFGSKVAIVMLVPVVAGILFGWRAGFFVGLFGTLINVFTPGGQTYEYLAIVPNAVMGLSAGLLRDRIPSPLPAFSIIIGYALILISSLATGVIPFILLKNTLYWKGLGYEVLVVMLGVIIITTLFRLVFEERRKESLRRQEQGTGGIYQGESLSTNSKIWIILAAIFLILTLLSALFFYFIDIAIVFIMSIALIIIVENINGHYQEMIKNYGLTGWKKRLLGYAVILFWLVAIFILLGSSINQLRLIISEAGVTGGIFVYYYKIVEPYLPQFAIDWLVRDNGIEKIQEFIFSIFSDVLRSITSLIVSAVLIIPLTFIMYYKRRTILYHNVYNLFPEKFRWGYLKVSKDINTKLQAFLSAKFLESVVIAAICCLGFYIFGIQGWLFLGLLCGFLNIMPYIGPLISAIPPLLIGLRIDPLTGLWAVVIVIVAQLIDNLYLVPFMISDKVRVDSLLNVVLILIGAKLYGPMGMIFALPLYLIYKIVLTETYDELVVIYGEK